MDKQINESPLDSVKNGLDSATEMFVRFLFLAFYKKKEVWLRMLTDL